MNIYADTNIWNELCDQKIDPDLLAEALLPGARLVLSYQTVYELLKTFAARATKPSDAERSFAPT